MMLLSFSLLLTQCAGSGQLKDRKYEAMLEQSLIGTGNNHRMKKVFDKAAEGEEITIAVIGGSITEGYNATATEDSWPSLAARGFRELFAPGDGSNVHLVNAGMAGTPSTLGMIRYKRDVLDRSPTPPDLVIVEFAVNDGDDETGGAAFESLVLDMLTAPNKPAVILLFSVAQTRWNLQERLIPVGERYGLPMISLKDAGVPETFFADQYHPSDYGHRIMADCIIGCLKKIATEDKSETDISLDPPPVIGRQFTGIKMIDAAHIPVGVTIEPGSFTSKDTALGSFKYDTKRMTFPDNWCRKNTADGKPFTLTLTCRNLVLVYKRTSAAAWGSANIYIDGQLSDMAAGSVSGGWDNPWTTVLIDEAEPAEHTIEIRMTEESARKNFTILAFGYSDD
jgi:lysophospholipase L1-like esterase